MKTKNANTKVNVALVTALYEMGYNMTQIGKMVGSVNGHISKVLKEAGVKARKQGVKAVTKKVDEVYEKRVERGKVYKSILAEGVTIETKTELAEFFGVDRSTISKSITAYEKSVVK